MRSPLFAPLALALVLALAMAAGCRHTVFGNELGQTVSPLAIAFADPAWDGGKVPAGMQCRRYGGSKSASPALKVSAIPASADTLIAEFNDLTYTPLSSGGGHGVISVPVPAGAREVVIPAVPGESMRLPEGVTGVRAHRATAGDIGSGYYLPPCSGGQGNTYEVTVHAVDSKTKLVVGQAKKIIGRY
ncbi:MAG: hypothetical protein H0S85_02105 [Desulfovibrionaceae bacterium]|jgi:hypothetical protein|nr:hypothetical protein [Desulfovibrionaceae bacterium]